MTWQEWVVMGSPWAVELAFVIGYVCGWKACAASVRKILRRKWE